ncbi:hypothetical protein ETAA8_05040 [Anatilimnocola aggregata]|uniref:Uncharacterized protein n=1 Tax=Anatilimnocola aggregata TaxID=2528021 RepID=A0A517Y5F8_9BACT|nr:hypothetical protein ETAA8_05040 [Anatilimnocola aggregata]
MKEMGKKARYIEQQVHGLATNEIPFDAILKAVIDGKKIK